MSQALPVRARGLPEEEESVEFVNSESASSKARKSQELTSILEELSSLVLRSDMPRRINLCEQALEMVDRIVEPELWAKLQRVLATSLTQSPQGERAENVERAIGHYEHALAVFTRDASPEDWAMTQHNLALAYRNRIRGERAENIDCAIGHYEQALSVFAREAFPEEWAATQNSLAVAYRYRIRGEKTENIEQAIWHYEQALAVYTRAAFPENWAMTQNNLAGAYRNRIRGEQAENLERSIGHYEEALSVYTWESFPEDWAMTQKNLGAVYVDRIRGERAENLEWTIRYCKQALAVYTPDVFPEDWAATQNILAAAYQNRINGERAENMERAIAHYEQALAVRTREAFPEDWAATQNNLGEAHCYRIRGEKAENIEQAIWHYQQALAVHTRDAFPEQWATTQNNLANACANRVRGERAENIERAIGHYEQALVVHTRNAFPERWAITQNNLANAYSSRIRGEQTENIERAIGHFEQALVVLTPDALPDDCRRTARNLANLLFERHRYADAIHPYQLVFQATDILLQQSFFREGLEAEVAETQGLAGRAAYALARTDDLRGAVETLEAGLARLLGQVLEQNRRDLERLPDLGYPHLLERYRDTMHRIEALRQRVQPVSQLSEQPSRLGGTASLQEIEAAQRELDEAVDAIRQTQIDGSRPYQDFLQPPTFDKIRQAATPDVPLVYLTTTSAGSLALVIQQNGPPLAIWLDNIDEGALENLLFGRDDAEGYLDGVVLGPDSLLKTVLDAIVPVLHERLVTPIAAQLQQLGSRQAVFIPTGRLSVLPLHALALDQLTIRFLPSAAALRSVIQDYDHFNLPPRLLAVGNPASQGQTSLAFARQEAQEIASLFEQLGHQHDEFCEESAKLDAIASHIAGRTHLHFSCHGSFDMGSPLASALYLAGADKLTLRDVLNGDVDISKTRLVVLSACQTGITDFQNVPDEAVGFPAGFLQAGVPGVVSTLWSVNDLSTALLMTQFYRHHLVDELAPVEALRQAQLWLRAATARELKLADHYQRLYLASDRRSPELLQAMRYYHKQPDVKPYTHPYYWAPFVFSGV